MDNIIEYILIHLLKFLFVFSVARENAISNKHPYSDKLTRIQTMLFDIVLAISKQSNKIAFPEKNTKELEEWILHYSKDLTPAEKYLLPVSFIFI